MFTGRPRAFLPLRHCVPCAPALSFPGPPNTNAFPLLPHQHCPATRGHASVSPCPNLVLEKPVFMRSLKRPIRIVYQACLFPMESPQLVFLCWVFATGIVSFEEKKTLKKAFPQAKARFFRRKKSPCPIFCCYGNVINRKSLQHPRISVINSTSARQHLLGSRHALYNPLLHAARYSTENR